MVIESVKDKYQDRIVAIMERLREAVKLTGFETSEISPTADEEYYWDFGLKWRGEGVGRVSFWITESEVRDGVKGGIGFMIDSALMGRIGPGLSPFNYTSEVWVKLRDEEGIENRFALMEDIYEESFSDELSNLRAEMAESGEAPNLAL